ncbi:shikimate dehydrogenase [Actinomycetospora sp. TBRC 11914]|uniref:shikimate dehydrogenase n=1 Tax=Actinomycetospora sp. TBRC 11914 TaxID=2729387 RepID=UPI00145E93B0|nr:shikimate dehydrogenase [Actinomycetospora sp. TBRC 11914]NMO91547.1 shikimate dehydrogenase [Actinomycetospora sp. TBRC 11914]
MTARERHVAGLVGAGIGPSLSPALHEREGAAHGLQYSYRRFDITRLGVAPGDVGAIVAQARREGFSGLNVTHPCKQLVIPHLDALSADAEALGAVNTVVFDGARAIGHNTDKSGFAAGFRLGLPTVPRDHVVQLGAGGAGIAVAHALLELGVGRLTVLDVDPGRAAAAAQALGPDRAVAADLERLPELVDAADGLVHATPIGMAAHPGLPLPAELLHPHLWVAEVVYRPLETALLREARRRGCRTLDGGAMAVFQAAHAFTLFTGRQPDTDRMLAHLAELVDGAPTERIA